MKTINTLILFVSLLVSGCDQIKSNIILSDTWACTKDAVFQTWDDGYPGDELKYKAIGCKTKTGIRVGYHIAWQDYGIKEHEGSFVDDKPSGEWSYYHDNGKLARRGNFRDGEYDGIWNYWMIMAYFYTRKNTEMG